jgi:S-formylglutathione hydrolase FrmB
MNRSLALALVLLALSPAAASAWPACTPRTAPVRIGLKEVDRVRHGRLLTLTLHSRALGDDQKVNVLLPDGYSSAGSKRYPVLYLLHGALSDYSEWVSRGDAEALTKPLGAIVVMPDNGSNGSYSDWFARGSGDPDPAPAWESYHVRELMPWIDAHFATRTDPGGRAIAGLSSGGHGATKYAAELAGRFGWVGAFSGAVETEQPVFQQVIQQCTWGEPAVDEVVWKDSDPTYLAENLRGVHVFLRYGDGQPGDLDPPGAASDGVEYVVSLMNADFRAALRAAGVRGVDTATFHGTHAWPYWQRDLRELVAWMKPRFGDALRAPRSFDYRSARTTFAAWGWDFRVSGRSVREFVYMTGVSSRGLTATGSGRLKVTTPRGYRGTYRVGGRSVTAKGGRLRFVVDLGPSHTKQQTDFAADATSSWRSAKVHIGR